MDKMEMREAVAADATRISQLAIRSKAIWDYSPEQMRVFAEELTLNADDILARVAYILLENEQLRGFYTLVERGEQVAELEHLFVDPQAIGSGFGRALFDHACRVARARGNARLVIQSDPNAAGFYDAMGCAKEREIASSIPGRFIPFFAIELGGM